MGLFSGLKKAVANFSEKRKANKAERQTKRKSKRDDRRAFKLAKIQTRQDGRSARVAMRSQARVDKATVQAHADEVAYQNGVDPIEHEGLGMQIAGMAGGAISSIFGKGSSEDAVESYQTPDSADGGFLGGSIDSPGRKPNMMLILGAALVAIFILPKILNNGRRKR